jgi:hypothetical protein
MVVHYLFYDYVYDIEYSALLTLVFHEQKTTTRVASYNTTIDLCCIVVDSIETRVLNTKSFDEQNLFSLNS